MFTIYTPEGASPEAKPTIDEAHQAAAGLLQNQPQLPYVLVIEDNENHGNVPVDVVGRTEDGQLGTFSAANMSDDEMHKVLAEAVHSFVEYNETQNQAERAQEFKQIAENHQQRKAA